MNKVKYQRILLKISGEALGGETGKGIKPLVISDVAKKIADVHETGTQIAVVVGGGNLWRGEAGEQLGMERPQADYIGMLGTIMNALALQDALEKVNVATRVQTSIEMRQVAEQYIRRKAIRHLEKGRVVIFAGGTGNPYFSTDTTSALRALEINADVILMGKNGVDGVYSDDPNINPDAVKYEQITHMDIIQKGLKVMDKTASSLALENNIPLIVFDLNDPENITRIVRGESIGTLIEGDK
ncbi:UMP kinase [Xylocopilactobacillus apicola]|uniref:Uridylate kinase n=1 Tax=Xylocopilactobacillus apicola TaxID=2932184 RepID=A0AAU9DSV2_9LACO|nr:UMP kinase [Xylocopilactobacillus apicola]BDR58388.1 uridylate kinase [Xylocopilactobacillus apicola]